jgi:hypothetical protein
MRFTLKTCRALARVSNFVLFGEPHVSVKAQRVKLWSSSEGSRGISLRGPRVRPRATGSDKPINIDA